MDNSYHDNSMTFPALTWKESCQKYPVNESGNYSAAGNGICYQNKFKFLHVAFQNKEPEY